MGQMLNFGKRMTKNFDVPEDATPIEDASDLIPNWVHNLSDLNRVEAENILKAQRKYLGRSAPDPKIWFHVAELKMIHKTMFGDVWKWAGIFRKSITSIGIHPSMIPSQLAEFCFEVNSWLEFPVELTFLEMAARIHHRLVFIHPFENGNGRFSRFIADRFLLAFKCSYPSWPTHLNQDGIVRKDYIQTLKSADKGDYEPLFNFLIKCGANDPELNTLIKNKFYKNYIQGKKGLALLKALLRKKEQDSIDHSSNQHLLHLAEKAGLTEICEILIANGREES